MATVKRPNEGEADPKSTTTPEPQRFHKTSGGAQYPIVRTYYDRRNNCVVDVYEKTRSQRARSLDTGNMEMVPGVKTQIHTFCKDVDIQRRELEKRGFTLNLERNSKGEPMLDKDGNPMYSIAQTSFAREDIDHREDV